MCEAEWIDPKDLLQSLRRSEDMVITNCAGERVWLKPCVLDGKRIGITDCCLEDDPCEHHARLTHQAIPGRQS